MTAVKKTYVSDFTKGKIAPKLIKFALPLFLANLLQVVYNMVDMVVVGQSLGAVGLSAVSVGGDVSNFLVFLAMGFGNAGQIIIAQYVGAGKKERVSKFIASLFGVLLVMAVAFTTLGLVFRKGMLQLMNTPEEAFAETLSYATVAMSGSVFVYCYNAIAAVMRGLGDSKHPFLFIGIASVLNIVLDVLFVMGFHMGAYGAALATVIAQAVSVVFSIAFILTHQERFGLKLKFSDLFHWDMEMVASLLKLGIPMAIKSASIQVSKLLVNSFVNSYGVVICAFAGIAHKISNIANLFSTAINTAGSSMVGQNIGAKEFKRVPRILITIIIIVVSIAVVMSGLILLFPEQIYRLFTQDEAVIEVGMTFLPIAVLLFFGAASRAPSNALIDGSGNYKMNFATAIFDGIVMRIGLSLLFGVALKMEAYGFWLGDALAGFTPFVIGLCFFLSGKWRVRGVKVEE